MPTIDAVAILKFIARVAVVLGLLLFMAGFSSLLADTITSLWSLVNGGINDFKSLFNNSGSNSCFLYYFHFLGLDVALTSFLVGVIGLGNLWAGFLISIMFYRTSLFAKNLLSMTLS